MPLSDKQEIVLRGALPPPAGEEEEVPALESLMTQVREWLQRHPEWKVWPFVSAHNTTITGAHLPASEVRVANRTPKALIFEENRLDMNFIFGVSLVVPQHGMLAQSRSRAYLFPNVFATHHTEQLMMKLPVKYVDAPGRASKVAVRAASEFEQGAQVMDVAVTPYTDRLYMDAFSAALLDGLEVEWLWSKSSEDRIECVRFFETPQEARARKDHRYEVLKTLNEEFARNMAAYHSMLAAATATAQEGGEADAVPLEEKKGGGEGKEEEEGEGQDAQTNQPTQ